jgi:flagellar biosynthesis/type III secretory pathway M-ring protein FliF/YscJ
MRIVVVAVDLLVVAFVMFAITRTVIRRRRHPELPPTPEAVEEMRKGHAHDKFMPFSGGQGMSR